MLDDPHIVEMFEEEEEQESTFNFKGTVSS
jgi:hypothetical protein